MGANEKPLEIEGHGATTTVQIGPWMRRKVGASLTMRAKAAAPDRVFLNLENVRGLVDSAAFRVYVGLPEGANPSHHPEHLAGSIALFGVRRATLPNGEHPGHGLTFVLEITKIIDELDLCGALDVDALGVKIVAVNPIPGEARISIGRVSIFRQNR